MRNVVLMQPAVGDMDRFRDRPTPPVALLAAAADLARDTEIRVVDQRIDADWRSRIGAAIDRNTVAVGVTALTGRMIRNALEMARIAKSARDVPLVWGGVHASLLPGQTARDEPVDHVVEGEGERPFRALVDRLASGGRTDDVPGVWCRRDGGVAGVARAGPEDPDALPPVPWHVVDMERYIGLYRGKRQFFYASSRGCPYRCAYCYNTVYNRRRWRALGAERVLSELDALRRAHDFRSVYFLDDDFFIDKARAMRILEGLRRAGLAAVLQGVDIRAIRRMSDAELDFLERAGVERISIGVESGTDHIRSGLLHKWGSIDTVRAQFRRLRGRRFLVLCTFIVGFPGETREEMRRTLDLALWTLRLGDNFRVPQLYNFTPYPGTELFRLLEQRGFRFPERLPDWGMWEWDTSHLFRDEPAVRDFLEPLVFLSKFLDRKVDDYGFGGPLLRLAYRLYRPVAHLRTRTGLLSPLPERAAYEWLARRVAA